MEIAEIQKAVNEERANMINFQKKINKSLFMPEQEIKKKLINYFNLIHNNVEKLYKNSLYMPLCNSQFEINYYKFENENESCVTALGKKGHTASRIYDQDYYFRKLIPLSKIIKFKFICIKSSNPVVKNTIKIAEIIPGIYGVVVIFNFEMKEKRIISESAISERDLFYLRLKLPEIEKIIRELREFFKSFQKR